MFHFAKKPLSPFNICIAGFSCFKSVLGKLWYLVFAAVLANEAWGFLCAWLLPIPQNSHTFASWTLLQKGLLVAAVFVAFLMHLYFSILFLHRIYYIVSAASHSKRLRFSDNTVQSIQESLRFALYKLPRVTIGIIIMLVAGCGILAVFTGVGYLGFKLLHHLDRLQLMKFVSIILTGGAFFCLSFLFFYYADLLFGDQGVWGSLKTGSRLLWGNWWRTAAVATLPTITILFFFFLGGIAISLVMFALKIDLVKAISHLPQLYKEIMLIAGMTIFACLWVLPQSFYLVQYNDLKLRLKLAKPKISN
jgi:hypothetical protein